MRKIIFCIYNHILVLYYESVVVMQCVHSVVELKPMIVALHLAETASAAAHLGKPRSGSIHLSLHTSMMQMVMTRLM